MFRIKRLYSFLIKSFLPLLLVMFSVCLFVLLMQFLWKYIDEMVGKGVEMKVLVELFAYAASSLVPMCLPLAILLASLMTFGNLGERFELLAIKAAGISLMRIMKPLIILVFIISVADYFYQDIVFPKAQAKLATMMISLKQKSPELDIPERSFYKELPGYNIYVEKKEKNGMFRNMMIYNYAAGSGTDAAVIVADSGCLKISSDKKYNILALYSGESFQNLRKRRTGKRDELIPYEREKFQYKEILIQFDSNFNMVDESITLNRDISKNMSALRSFIDSVSIINDSTGRSIFPSLVEQTYASVFNSFIHPPKTEEKVKTDSVYTNDFENFFIREPIEKQLSVVGAAKAAAARKNTEYSAKMFSQSESNIMVRKHQIELNRRYAAAVACLLFFFIGAPLGAIIRKGGLGLPTVLSVFIYILYFTVDTFGFKFARQGVLPVWQGIWLSSFMLFVLGAFITHKAINDFMLNLEDVKRIMRIFKKITGFFGINIKIKEEEETEQ
jgi:lipopolysaccharide export system permease protein